MEILITNDDGYTAKGIGILTEIMRQFGSVTVIAPKFHQSGMSMAVSLGFKAIRFKKIYEEGPVEARDGQKAKGRLTVCYLDATPASCVKFGLNTIFLDKFPDVIVSGINHGSNAASASCYSGTLGAAQEGALNGIVSIGVSLNTLNPDADFSAVERYFPDIFSRLIQTAPAADKGIYYNINFPNIPADRIRGIRTGRQGMGRWIKEFTEWNPKHYACHGITPEMLGQNADPKCEEGEELYMMTGTFVDDPRNAADADHRLMEAGYISIVAHNIDTTDPAELDRLRSLDMDQDW